MKKEKDLQVENNPPSNHQTSEEAIQEEFEVLEEQSRAREEALMAAENIDSVPEPEESDNINTEEAVADVMVDEAEEMEPTDEELEELSDPNANDPDYLEYSAEAVGYENRQIQWDTYRTILNYIGDEDSILDFGCGRGDFERFLDTEYPDHNMDYTGIEMNQQLVDASKKAYDSEVDIRCMDWFKLPSDLKEDWCINIGSNNLRYDGDTKMTDEAYLHNTIDQMMAHCTNGSIILLSSDVLGTDDGLLNWNAGKVLNWAQKKYGACALDHSMSNDLFVLIIYNTKTEKNG